MKRTAAVAAAEASDPMKTCPACGAKYSDDLSFCLKDGNRLSGVSASGITSKPTEPLSPPAGTAQRQEVSTQETAATRNRPGAPTVAPTKAYRFSAVDPKSRMGCIVTVGQVSAILLLVFGLGAGIVMYNLMGSSADRAATEPAPVMPVPATNTSSVANTSTANSMSNTASPGRTANVNTNRSLPFPATNNAPSAGGTPEAAPSVAAKPSPTAGRRPVDILQSDPDIPVVKATPKRPNTIAGGVLNGKATYLPKPPYPPAARAVRASGSVSVQVLIDEKGNIVSASAVSGHPLLRAAAVSAARQARFSPTMVGGVPVKVSGIITYNFVP